MLWVDRCFFEGLFRKIKVPHELTRLDHLSTLLPWPVCSYVNLPHSRQRSLSCVCSNLWEYRHGGALSLSWNSTCCTVTPIAEPSGSVTVQMLFSRLGQSPRPCILDKPASPQGHSALSHTAVWQWTPEKCTDMGRQPRTVSEGHRSFQPLLHGQQQVCFKLGIKPSAKQSSSFSFFFLRSERLMKMFSRGFLLGW